MQNKLVGPAYVRIEPTECNDPDCFLFHCVIFDRFGQESVFCGSETENELETFIQTFRECVLNGGHA